RAPRGPGTHARPGPERPVGGPGGGRRGPGPPGGLGTGRPARRGRPLPQGPPPADARPRPAPHRAAPQTAGGRPGPSAAGGAGGAGRGGEGGLPKRGRLAEPALRKALEGGPLLEVRQRLQRLLEDLGGPVTSPQVLRASRAVQVLEQLGSAEARAVLLPLTRGAPEDWVTVEARAALERLAKRTARGR